MVKNILKKNMTYFVKLVSFASNTIIIATINYYYIIKKERNHTTIINYVFMGGNYFSNELMPNIHYNE